MVYGHFSGDWKHDIRKPWKPPTNLSSDGRGQPELAAHGRLAWRTRERLNPTFFKFHVCCFLFWMEARGRGSCLLVHTDAEAPRLKTVDM